MKSTFILAAATAFALTSTTAVPAAEPIHSPRGKANQIQHVQAEARTLGGRADRSVILRSPRHAEKHASLRKVAKTTGSRSLARHNRPVSPRLLMNEPWRANQFEVAPLK